MTILVEGFGADAIEFARFLATEGHIVRLASAASEPVESAVLRRAGIGVEPHADLDADPGDAEVAYLDVWTPEVAPRVQRLRAQGTRVSCLGDLLLERWQGPTAAVTGTAGKSTATHLTATLLSTAGIETAVSSGARAANLWPTADLLERSAPRGTLLVVELTSSHLAFMSSSPTVATLTCFWPDHLELHGTLAAYRNAKETIVRHQGPTDMLILNTDDPAVASFASLAPGEIVAFSTTTEPERGAFVRNGTLVVRWDDAEAEVARFADLSFPPAHETSVLAAVATALAIGAPPEALATGLHAAQPLPFRAIEVARIGEVRVVDDGLAATPAKTAATLAAYPPGSIVIIAGGTAALATGPVHSASEEQPAFDRACSEIARVARRVVVFGPAASRLEAVLSTEGVPLDTAASLDDALELATAAVTADAGALALIFSPMFPVDQTDRERFAALARAAPGVTASGPGYDR